MAKPRATEDTLGLLHELTAQALIKAVRDMKAGGEVNASVLGQAIKLLKDNNISCAPGTNSTLEDLLEEVDQFPFQSDAAH